MYVKIDGGEAHTLLSLGKNLRYLELKTEKMNRHIKILFLFRNAFIFSYVYHHSLLFVSSYEKHTSNALINGAELQFLRGKNVLCHYYVQLYKKLKINWSGIGVVRPCLIVMGYWPKYLEGENQGSLISRHILVVK